MLLTILLLGLINPFTTASPTPESLSRGVLSKSNIICCHNTGQPWKYAVNTGIQVSINQLKAKAGSCTVPAGPKVCVDLICDTKVKIQLCNDNNYAIQPTCSYLAEYAQEIKARCTMPGDPISDTPSTSCGQQFDTDNYNVIVRKNNDGRCT